jgi:hypothetical protein
MTPAEFEKLRSRFTELLKRGEVIALAEEIGLTRWKIRTLLDGENPPLAPHPLPFARKKPTKKKARAPVRFYQRDAVFLVLGIKAEPAQLGGRTVDIPERARTM